MQIREASDKKFLFCGTNHGGDEGCALYCCVRFGSRRSPSSQLPLLATPQSEAVSARPDYHSGTRLKRMLQMFIQTCLKLSSSRQMQGSCGHGFYVVAQGVSPMRSFSFAQLH